MTTVLARKDGDFYTILASGHADEETMVCTAVSAILYALAGWLENAGDKAETDCADIGCGVAEFSFCGGSEAEAVFSAIVIGLMQVARQYPQALAVELEDSGEEVCADADE